MLRFTRNDTIMLSVHPGLFLKIEILHIYNTIAPAKLIDSPLLLKCHQTLTFTSTSIPHNSQMSKFSDILIPKITKMRISTHDLSQRPLDLMVKCLQYKIMTKRSQRNAVITHFCESSSVRAAINSIGSSIDRTY